MKVRWRLTATLLAVAVVVSACAPATTPVPAAPIAPAAATSTPAPAVAAPAPTRAVPVIQPAAPTPTPVRTGTVGRTPPKFRQPVDGLTKYPPAPWEDWTPADIKRGGTFTMARSGDAPHLDIALNNGTAVQEVGGQIYDFLVRIRSSYDADPYALVCEPALAQSWEEAKDSMSVTFKLRPNVKWQNVAPVNGREFTSDDAKFSIEYYKKGGNLAAFFSVVSAVETPDKLTVVVRFKERTPGFVAGVGGQTAYIMPHEIFDRDKDFRGQAIGTGPFIPNKWVKSDRMEFIANKSHWDVGLDGKPLPYLDNYKILFITDTLTRVAAFRAGRVDLPRLVVRTEKDVDRLRETSPGATVTVTLPDKALFMVGADVSKPPFNDVRVRRALSMSFDREEIGKVALDGNYLNTTMIPWPLFFEKPPKPEDIPWTKYDPAQAKRLLSEAGHPNGIKKVLAWSAITTTIQPYAEIMKAQAAKAGFDLTLQQQDSATWSSDWYSGHAKFGDKLIIGYIPPLGWDYESYLAPYLHSKGDRNYINLQDPEIDAVLDKMRATTDPSEQKKLALQVYQRELDQAYRPAFPGSYSYMVHSGKIKNYRMVPRTYIVETYNVRYAWRAAE